MLDNDFLFNFIDGLHPWENLELRQHDVQDFSTIIIVEKSLAKYFKKSNYKGKYNDNHEGDTFQKRDKGNENWSILETLKVRCK